jgi:hypothetical protein
MYLDKCAYVSFLWRKSVAVARSYCFLEYSLQSGMQRFLVNCGIHRTLGRKDLFFKQKQGILGMTTGLDISAKL